MQMNLLGFLMLYLRCGIMLLSNDLCCIIILCSGVLMGTDVETRDTQMSQTDRLTSGLTSITIIAELWSHINHILYSQKAPSANYLSNLTNIEVFEPKVNYSGQETPLTSIKTMDQIDLLR